MDPNANEPVQREEEKEEAGRVLGLGVGIQTVIQRRRAQGIRDVRERQRTVRNGSRSTNTRRVRVPRSTDRRRWGWGPPGWGFVKNLGGPWPTPATRRDRDRRRARHHLTLPYFFFN